MAATITTTSQLVLCPSLTKQCKFSNHQNQLSLSKPNKLSSSFIATKRPPTFLLPTPKFSEAESPVIEAEPEPEPKPEPETESGTKTEAAAAALSVIEVAPTQVDAPKREEVFAVVMVGGRQYIVIPGRYIYVQRLKGTNVDDKITLNKVLLVGTRDSAYIGKPVVTNAAVHAVVEENGLDPKVIVFKYKKKKHYQRTIGHRQPNTRIRITGITGYQDYPVATLKS